MPTFGRNIGQKVVHIFKEFAEVLSFMDDEHAQLSDFCEYKCCNLGIECDYRDCEHYDFCHSFTKGETDISPQFVYNVYRYTFGKNKDDEDEDMGIYFKDGEKLAPTKTDTYTFWLNENKKWKELKSITQVQCKNWKQVNVSSESGQCTFIYNMKL